MKKQTRKTNTDVSRRDFVRKTAAGIGGVGAAALAGLGSTEAGAAEIPKRWDRTADVVVAGAGAAGLPAAIEAAQNGASVIVIDQNYDIGGHAIRAEARCLWAVGRACRRAASRIRRTVTSRI
jgi:glutamate dehydrogenase/leucine dehydrogenase